MPQLDPQSVVAPPLDPRSLGAIPPRRAAALLLAIGARFLLADFVHISILTDLLVIVAVTGASLLASVLFGVDAEADS